MSRLHGNQNNIRSYADGRKAGGSGQPYLSDEALQELIASVEAEPMICPPKGFRDGVIARVRRKRQRSKNIALFSYSMKVIAATAAALALVLIIPENIHPEEGRRTGERLEWQAGENQEEKERGEAYREQENILYRFSSHLDGICSALNGRLNQLVRTEGHDL